MLTIYIYIAFIGIIAAVENDALMKKKKLTTTQPLPKPVSLFVKHE
jgi:hypothetical protein